MFLRVLAATTLLLLASCGSGMSTLGIKPYRIEIQQGNFVSQEMVAKLKPGMSKDQVRFVLGTPLIADSFHADRWDYVFRRTRTNSTVLEERKIAVFFENGKFTRVEGDVMPEEGTDRAGIKSPAAQPAPSAEAAAATAAQANAGKAPSGSDAAAPATEKPQEKSWWQKMKDLF